MSFFAGCVGTSIVGKAQHQELANRIIAKYPVTNKQNIVIQANPYCVCIASEDEVVCKDQCVIIAAGKTKNGKNWLEEVIASYKKYGDEFITKTAGFRYLVLADQKKQKLILATDQIGLNNVYFSQTSNGLVFGSSADNVIEHPDVNPTISPQAIYNYIYFHHCPSPGTIYNQVHKLEGGQILIYQSAKYRKKYYWIPEFREEMAFSPEDAGKELRYKLQQAVKELSDTADDTAAFLSGGLDSSSVAAMLAQVFPGKAKTFTIGFPVEGYDEVSYARFAAEKFATRQYEYYLSPDDTITAVPKIAAFYDEPFGNSSALAAYYCAKLAKDNGIEVLLAGDGGDELFAGNERYARQLLFEKYWKVPAWLRSALQFGLHRTPSLLLKNKIIFKAKRYIDQATVPLPDRLQDYNFLHRHPGNEIFVEDFLQQIETGTPLQSLRDCYHRPDEASCLNRMLYMDWKSTLHDNDLVKVNKMCELAGVEVKYPLLDQEIVDLSCKIPSAIKLKGQELRWFYKQAMQDFLPEQIINKSKHGFGLPFGIWLKDHQPLKELAYDSIDDLKKREFIRAEFLDHAITMHQSIHAAYYGELIWILMMLEHWFQARKL